MYGALVTALARTAWGWRLELVVLADLVLSGWLLSRRLGTTAAVLVLAGALAVVVIVGRPRRWIAGILRARRIRRRWGSAVSVAGPTAFGGRVPTVLHIESVPAGDLLHVRIPNGGRAADLDTAREALAVALGARDVRVTREPAHAGRAQVLVVRHDPLARRQSESWPWSARLQANVWEPIPVGVGEDGQPITLSLPERNVLLGGEPGAGKSAAMSPLVATAALDPNCQLWLLDGKLVELATWARCVRGTAGVDTRDAIALLTGLRREMDGRYAELLASRRRKVSPESGLPLHVVVCDELAHYLTSGDRKERAEFADLMRDLVSRGRAAGIIVVAATQKPSSDIIPTSLRDLFGFRWALRCATPQASDTILGSGWASAGFSAADVDAAHRGVGYLLHEGGTPVRLRSYYLDDVALDAIAHRAEALRRTCAPLEMQS